MDFFLIALISIVIVVLAVIILLRGRHTTRPTHRPVRSKSMPDSQTGTLAHLEENKFFWGAELSKPGCAESRALLGKQFPFDEAPELPVPGCKKTAATCTCEFRGLRDRRVRPRRVNPDRRSEFRFDKTHPDRRTNAGRRRGDRWVHHAL